MSTSVAHPPVRKAKGTKPFIPDLVYFEPGALEYEKGKRIMEWVTSKDIPYQMTTSHNRITNLLVKQNRKSTEWRSVPLS